MVEKRSGMRVGIAGLGTVGCGTIAILERNAGLIAARTGRTLEITAVSARDPGKKRGVDLSGARWYADPLSMVEDPGIDIIAELIGGADGVALELVKTALAHGKHVVTANKALLAHHGAELALLAARNRVTLAFEAAVAGGIPVVKALREGLAANRVSRVYGILNGTSNYILSVMRDSGRDFADVLAEAQTLGYAEADPTFDVDGIDAAHKLALLASIAFGGKPDFDSVHIEGIRHVTALDIAFAEELGYRIKLLGVARLTESGLEQRMHPCMVAKDSPIAQVEGVFNGVVIDGDDCGAVMLEGRGAGGAPTGSAVVADLMDIARGLDVPAFGVDATRLADHPPAPMSAHTGRYYIRLMVFDRPGVLAEISAILRDQEISIEALIQRSRNPGQAVPIVLTTHDAVEASMSRALERIAALGSVIDEPRMIRIETL